MSHLTLQEVIERINENYASTPKKQVVGDYGRYVAHRPEFYIPRITLRLANFMFGANVLPVDRAASES